MPSLATAASDRFAGDEDELSTFFGLQSWISQADAKWRISFPYKTQQANPGIAAGTLGRNESELTFKNIDSPMTIATGGWKIYQHFSLDALYGRGSVHGGEGSDTDLFIPDNGNAFEYSQSRNDVTGDSMLWGVNLYYNKRKYSGDQSGPWGMVIGYLHYEDKLRMQNAVQTTSVPFEGLTFPPVGPFPSSFVLDQTYDFSWNVLKLGVLHQAEISKSFSYSADFSIYPYVDYRGEGYWNLRTIGPNAFRSESPNFVQTSKTGYGYEAALSLLWKVSENTDLSAGYRYFFLYAKNGTDTTYFADGSAYQDSLDWVTVTRQGLYAEMSFKF